jgi:ATP-dependent helicase/nuclease subunit A
VYKITGGLAESDVELGEIYEKQKARDWVSKLNTLYVAMTRARAELYIVGVRKPRDSYPFDLIASALPAADSETSSPALLFRSSPERPATPYRDKPAAPAPKAESLRLPRLFEPAPNTRDSLNYEGIRRGEIAHHVLAGLEFVDAGRWDDAVAAAIATLVPGELEAPVYGEVGRAIAGAFAGSPLEEIFARRPGRCVLREFEFCDAAGRVFRMDRIVVDPDTITIVDFKMGADPDPGRRGRRREEDRAQVRSYAAIMRDIHPDRPVRALLAYIDQRDWEEAE